MMYTVANQPWAWVGVAQRFESVARDAVLALRLVVLGVLFGLSPFDPIVSGCIVVLLLQPVVLGDE